MVRGDKKARKNVCGTNITKKKKGGGGRDGGKREGGGVNTSSIEIWVTKSRFAKQHSVDRGRVINVGWHIHSGAGCVNTTRNLGFYHHTTCRCWAICGRLGGTGRGICRGRFRGRYC